MTQKIIKYEVFENWEDSEPDEDQQIIDQVGSIVESKDFEETVKKSLGGSLVVDEINFHNEDSLSFSIDYSSQSFGGQIPTRITLIIDKLAQDLAEKFFGVQLEWNFGRNGNCNTVIMWPDEKVDLRVIKGMKLVK